MFFYNRRVPEKSERCSRKCIFFLRARSARYLALRLAQLALQRRHRRRRRRELAPQLGGASKGGRSAVVIVCFACYSYDLYSYGLYSYGLIVMAL